ncbi:MAG TPA: protein kinase [Polyangiaceae bacterium]|nr:protein kinase [Polyangiaceae bacterium]
MTTIDADPFRWVGATIEGKYRIDALVAEGGCGVVYVGHHLGFDHPVAIKCLNLESFPASRREAFLESFRAEGRIMSRLSQESPAIVRPIDLGGALSPSGQWTPYLVLEWVPGRSLQEDLAERPASGLGGRSIAEALALLEPVAQALGVAHDQGIAHRDVKPGNILLTTSRGLSTCKLVDFGVAKTMTVARIAAGVETTAVGPKVFTSAYGAPEQFDPSYGATGPWTDVFAYALVFVTVVAGRRALEGDDPQRLWAQAVDPERRPTLRALGAGTSDELERVLTRALAVDPRNRYRTLRELWADLAAASHAGPNTLRDPPRVARTAIETAPPLSLAAPPSLGAPVPPTLRDPTLAAPPARPLDNLVRTEPARTGERASFASPPGPPPPPAHIPPAPASGSGPPGGGPLSASTGALIAVLLLLAATVALVVIFALRAPSPAASAALAVDGSAAVVDPAPPAPEAEQSATDGTDSKRPVLAPADLGFVDTRAGWGWGDRCWKSLQAGKWGWAKAECDEAMKLNPASPNPRASLLYNQGLIAAHAGDVDEARNLYTESLRLRTHKDVQEALAALGSAVGRVPGNKDLSVAVAAARAAAVSKGWKYEGMSAVPGHSAAIVQYSKSPGGALPQARMDFVGAGPVVSLEATTLEQKKSGEHEMWNLAGDGRRFVVIEGAAAMPQTASERTIELVGDTWRESSPAPGWPTRGVDEDGDGVPEIPAHIVGLTIVQCPRVSCPTYGKGVSVQGIMGWDGAGFAKDLASFVPLYRARLARARADAVTLRAARIDPSECPTAALDAAARVYVYATLTGVDRAAAMREADDTMARYSLSACKDDMTFNDSFKDWQVLRSELWKTPLPSLTRARRR